MKLLLLSILAAIILSPMHEKKDSVGNNKAVLSQKSIFSFGIISDVQYADIEPAGTRFYRSSPGKLREAIASFKDDSVDFIISLGDLIDTDYASFKPVINIIDSSGIKTYHVTGNHDYAVETSFKKKLPVLSSSKEGYYSFIHHNFRFIILNGNELSTYISNNKASIKEAGDFINTLKSNGEINGVEWNGGLRAKQIGWLDNQLKAAVNENEKVFIICHFPVVPDNVHNLLNFKEILPLLEKYNNIIAWFNGHNHYGNYGNFNMIHFITFKGMVETEYSNSYAIVDVYSNKIWINGYGREKSQILAY